MPDLPGRGEQGRVRIFLTSDTHLSHGNIIDYCNRPFASAEEMDEALIANWNDAVRPDDHVWHLGDVAMRRTALQLIRRLNGHKRLVLGNHDIFDYKDYVAAGFQKLAALRVFNHIPRIICSHIPIHPDSLGGNINIHGHTHNNPSPAGRYVNVCVEQTNYRPITLEEAVARATTLLSLQSQ